MKTMFLDFKGPSKVPAAMEEKTNQVLSQGGLKAVSVCESQGGRLYMSLLLDEKSPGKTKCKVFRNSMPERLKEESSKFLSEGHKTRSMHYTISDRSNQLMLVMFYDESSSDQKSTTKESKEELLKDEAKSSES